MHKSCIVIGFHKNENYLFHKIAIANMKSAILLQIMNRDIKYQWIVKLHMIITLNTKNISNYINYY